MPASLAREKKRLNLQKGDPVTCLHEVDAYYSGYAGNPVVKFRPGDAGVFYGYAPKVRVVGDPPVHDQLDEFAIVDFEHEGKTQRTSLNLCNVAKL